MAFNTVLLSLISAVVGTPTIVLDDSSASLQGGMQCTSSGYQGSFHHSNGSLGNVQDFAVWDFNVSRSGCYLVEEYHPVSSCSGHAMGHVPLRVDYCKGQTAWTSIDQSLNGGRWNRLGHLPFYVDWPGRVLLSRANLPDYVCPQGQCFWVGDAFRLTYLAATCHEAEAQAEHPTAREQAEAELDGQEVEQTRNVVSFVVQAVLREPEMLAEKSTFSFRPPLDGCYMVEEHHPHVPGAVSEPLEINFCRGMVADSAIDHTDDRHLKWNYVASLPFFDDSDGSVTLPRPLLERAQEHRGDHEFRLTHLGPTCNSPHAQVHRLSLRITADFGLIRSRIDAFRSDLQSVLARAAGVELPRLRVSHLSEGSIVAEVTILPEASSRVPDSVFGSSTTPSAAARALEDAAVDSSFAQEVCALAGAAAGCAVSVASSGRVQPLAVRRPVEPEGAAEEAEDGGLPAAIVGIIVGCSVVAALLLLGGGFMLIRMRGGRGAKPVQKKVEDPFEVEDPVKPTQDAATKAQPGESPAQTEDAGKPAPSSI